MSLVEKRIEIDGKYDLNLDRTPVLSIVTENSVGCGLPIAFGNKENHQTIRLAIEAIKKKIFHVITNSVVL
ncbi:unnamed protein product [Rhizophagus irregularis]|nr:unnamed protein product [Rhizophagus irregularis]